MDWITGLQQAIDYLEDHLTEPLDIRAAASRAYLSSYYFQRLFSALCGYTVGEYVRNRRLTQAGFELLTTSRRVIDIALDYGYDSPESFTRAFSRFHGATPTAVRSGCPIRSFARLSVNVSLKGGERMKALIEQKQSFRILAKKRTFSNDGAVSSKEVPLFWDDCHRDGTVRQLFQIAPKEGVLGGRVVGACLEEACEAGRFCYAIGAEFTGGPVPEGFELVEIPARTWAAFETTGPMPTAMQQLLHQIYAEFFPTSDYQPLGDLDLELYSEGRMGDPGYKSSIWIAIAPKNG